MLFLFTCNYEEDLIENGQKKVGNTVLLFRSGAHKSWVTGPVLTVFKFDQDFMSVLVTYKYEETQIKNAEKSWRHCFPFINYMGFFSALKGM